MDPYTRPFAAYSRNSPVKSTPDQTPSSYSHNRPVTTYADQKDNRTATTTLAYGNQASTHAVEERRSVKRYSPPEADNSVSKPSKISKDNDVLARANEVLQRSLRLTNPVGSNDSNPPARSHTPTPTTTTTVSPPVQNVNNRTLDILNRANAILNKSANYSKDPAAHVTTDRTNLSKTVASFNRADFAVKETIATQSDNYTEEPVVNTRFVAAPAEKTTTNPRNLLSRIDQALQNSNQINANPNPYEPKPYSQNQYLSPQKSQYDYRSPQKSTGKNFKASEYAMRGQGQGLHEAYHDALRRSQEIVERNVEELMRSDHKRHASGNKRDVNLKSSYVMERKTNYDDDQGQGEDVVNPGIYLPAQGIKPKFVEEYYEDGTIYKGEKIRTAKHGRGEFLYEDSSKYEGEWENDRKNGYGVQTFPNGTIQYDGEWKDDVYHGNGILMNGDAKEERGFDHNNFDTLENSWIKYEGEFMNGKMHGLGTLTLFNNERYVGKFKYDQVHGAGVFHKRNGETVSGEWENSKFARNL